MVRRTQVDIPAMLDKVATRVRSAHRQGPFEMNVPGELPVLTGDPVLLRRVLDNLLDNANKYSDAGTKVRLDVRASETRIEFTVLDEGIGISAEDLPHITTPFFRTDRSRARRTGGLGLGLSLARRIVEAHAGTMTIESEVGAGTRVCVSFPASRETQVHVPSATHSASAAQ
jgi:two-component system, OmpR family, sensor kinase